AAPAIEAEIVWCRQPFAVVLVGEHRSRAVLLVTNDGSGSVFAAAGDKPALGIETHAVRVGRLLVDNLDAGLGPIDEDAVLRRIGEVNVAVFVRGGAFRELEAGGDAFDGRVREIDLIRDEGGEEKYGGEHQHVLGRRVAEEGRPSLRDGSSAQPNR